MSGRALIVHGLNRPAFYKEASMGETPIDFKHLGVTKVIGINQTTENPFTITDNHNQTQIKTTTGDHLQSANNIVNGRRDVGLDVTTAIDKNSFIALLSKYYPYYTYTGKAFDTTITAIVNSASYSTITVDDSTGIKKGMEVNISGRVDTDEDQLYTIILVSGDDVTIKGLIDATDLTGTFDSTIGVHSLKIQSDDCNKTISNSYTGWLPNNFPNEGDSCENGELVNGLAPKELNLELVAATAQIVMRGKNYEREYTNQPLFTDLTSTTDYLEPTTDNDGFSAINNAVMEYYDEATTTWRELDTESLTVNTVLGLNEDQVVFRAGEFSRVIIDGASVGGSYSALVYDADDLNNISNQIIDRRSSEQNTVSGRMKLINTDGTGFYVEGNVSFINPGTPTKDLGGFKFTTEYMFTKKGNYSNVECVVMNNYTEDLTNYL